MSENHVQNINTNSCNNNNTNVAAQNASLNVQRKIKEFQPDVDIEETKENYIVTADIPGLNAEDIQLNLDKDILAIEAKSDIDGLAPRVYRRQFRVMRGLDSSKCHADYKLGVLTLRLPKPTNEIPQQIKISCE